MDRPKKSTIKNNIVIVCEGSETETAYLLDLKNYIKDRFDDVRIVPFGREASEAEKRDKALKIQKNNGGRKPRDLKLPSINGSGKFYWVKEEPDTNLYNVYKQQPTRYVREAQLFMNDGYVEAWAVYDLDTFSHHEEAFNLANSIPNLHIAFSSVSFEEWMLLHFERNPTSFDRSCCKDGKVDRGCGKHPQVSPNDCHGSKCVIGYLREKGYIPDFKKKDKNLYSSYTRDRLNIIRINCAWVKSLSSEPKLYLRNPYTDFDVLLEKLLGLTDKYLWIGGISETIITGCHILINRDNANDKISLKNTDSRPFIFHWCILDEHGKVISRVNKDIINKGETIDIELKSNQYLCIEDVGTKYIITN